MSSAERVERIVGAAEEDGPVLRVIWPVLPAAARYGLAGEIVAAVEPHSEADPAALLVTALAAFGALVGAGPHARADGAEHPARIWPLIVGDTAKSRKGTSWVNIRRVFDAADPGFTADRVLAGFGSGEALVDAVGGDQDRRALVVETEYGRVLAVCRREGSTLATLLRQAWDGGRLQVRSRVATSVADNAHVVVIGHVTRAELLARMAESDALGGSLNRFVIVAARRSKLLPSGGNLDDSIVADFGRKVAFVASQVRTVGLVRRTPEAEALWGGLYAEMAADDPGGLLGAATARDSAQMLRLSVAYALIDGSKVIRPEHILAAQGVWDYSRASAAGIFGERTGDPMSDLILDELQRHGSEGLDGTAIRDLLGRHAKRERIERATDILIERGLATKATKGTHGRPRTVVQLATKATKATKVEEQLTTGDDDSASRSLEDEPDESIAAGAYSDDREGRQFWSTPEADDYLATFGDEDLGESC